MSDPIAIETLHDLRLKLKSAKTTIRLGAVKSLVAAFSSAVEFQQTGHSQTEDAAIVTPEVFNETIHICFHDMFPSICKYLGIPHNPSTTKLKHLPSTSKRWVYIKRYIRFYLVDLLKLSAGFTDAGVVGLVIKHMRTLHQFYLSFPKVSFKFVKRLVEIWCTGDDEVNRILVFFCLHKLANHNPKYFDLVLKKMFNSFAANSRLTSSRTWPLINLMQRCFVEVCRLDTHLAYRQCFVYLRQLSIHLRTAIRKNNQESISVVCSWQYIHCLHLFSKLICAIDDKSIRLLLHPTVQIILGTVKLLNGPRYYPLRFQCIRALTLLCQQADVYIPVLPLIVEIFTMTDFNKKPKVAEVQKLDFSITLKYSKHEMQDRQFFEKLIDEIYEASITFLSIFAHNIAFPELVMPLVVSLKKLVKGMQNGGQRKALQNLLDRIEENSKEIESRRTKDGLDMRNNDQIDQWHRRCKSNSPPLLVYFENYKKLRKSEQQSEILENQTYRSKIEDPAIEPLGVGVETEDEEEEEECGFKLQVDVDDDEEEDPLFTVKDPSGGASQPDAGVVLALDTKSKQDNLTGTVTVDHERKKKRKEERKRRQSGQKAGGKKRKQQDVEEDNMNASLLDQLPIAKDQVKPLKI